jgi:tetratricopeptide (TPR) repeat protein
MKTLCLVMIVKDQAEGLGRGLDSVKGLISHWVVADMGSTDGTRKVIEESIGHIPGSIHDLQGVASAENRTHALELARGKADYDLVLDANMTVTASAEFRHNLEADSYLLRQEGPAECWVERLVSDRHRWRYIGVAREFIFSNTACTQKKLPDLSIACHEEDSDRTTKLNSEIELLKEALERGSNVPRATFYLAQAYRDLGNLPRAIEHYEERLKMGGWEEELWYSAYQIACMQQRLRIAWMLVLSRYLEAYQLRPTRAEPLFRIARYYRETGQYRLGHLFAHAAMEIPVPDDLLFIERSVYQYELPLEYALCGFHLGMKEEAVRVAREILSEASVPEDARQAAKQCVV